MLTIANHDAFHESWESVQHDMGLILRYAHADHANMTPKQYCEAKKAAARIKCVIDFIVDMIPVDKPDASVSPDADKLANMFKTLGGFTA